MQVSKWGNSLAIRLPASVVEALGLHEGDDIEVMIADERIFQVRKNWITRPSLRGYESFEESCRLPSGSDAKGSQVG